MTSFTIYDLRFTRAVALFLLPLALLASTPIPLGFWRVAAPSGPPPALLWLKADAITGLNDGDAVATWPDASGNGRDYTQATAANRPLWKTGQQNGQPSVRFDGSNDYMLGSAISTGTNYSLALVTRISATGAYRTIFGNGGDSDGYRFLKEPGNNRMVTHRLAFDVNANSMSTNTELWVVTYDGSKLNVWVNGTQQLANWSGGLNVPTTRSEIGRYTPGIGLYLLGDLFEVLLYDRVVTDQERATLETDLNGKYAIY